MTDCSRPCGNTDLIQAEQWPVLNDSQITYFGAAVLKHLVYEALIDGLWNHIK